MSTPCNNKHPLNQSGVSQDKRVLEALLPGYALVDERAYPDLILFASRYAGVLNYYNHKNRIEGSWEPFMLMDVSVTLARLIRLDVRRYSTYAKDIYDQVAATASSQESDLKNYFKTLFDLCFSMTVLLDNYYRSLPDDFEFKEIIGNTVRSRLPEYLYRLQAYYQAAKTEGLINPQGTFLFADRPGELILSQDFRAGDLSDIWTSPGLPPSFTPAFSGTNSSLKIKNTITHNLFTGMVDQYLKVLASLVETAPGYLDATMSEFPTHSPHYALFLAFIKLFRISQDRLNNFTARHLDLYYRDVLRLNKKDPEPDIVHLLFELSKTAGDSVYLEQGTLFKAGKDRDGKELFYQLTEPSLLGKGKVAALKNTFAGSKAGFRRVSAGIMANSGDGMGAPLLHADKSWETFGSPDRTAARAGFGIASDYLFLAEGKRIVSFTFRISEGKIHESPAQLNSLFRVELSAEKGWFQVLPVSRDFTISDDKKSFTLTMTLDGGDPPVVPWKADVHGYQFRKALPMALLTLVDGAANEAIWKLKIAAITLKVNAEHIKNLQIENDEGALDPVKPFDLFGAIPRNGAAFIVGSKELFMKARRPMDTLDAKLSLTWDEHDSLISVFDENPGLFAEYLEDSRWKEETSFGSQPLFDLSGGIPTATTRLDFHFPALDVEKDYTPGSNYSTRSKWGFLRLTLNGELGHATYAKTLAESIEVTSVEEEGTTTTSVRLGDVPEPYTPRVKEIKLQYEVSTALQLPSASSGETDDFIHLTPFGHTPVKGEAFPCSLLPSFPDEGELFIGLDQLQTGQTLPLLFQVAEGTTDPLVEKQEVVWHYLDEGNTWTPFDKEKIADSTGGLLKSGIIKFSIPANLTRNDLFMGGELHWLKASVAGNTRAIPRLVSVNAQAAVAQFYDYKKEGNYFKEPLPAGTISKLLVAHPGIKRIDQPGTSIKGRTMEDNSSWYRWVSERLRHKQRAVAPWDYERLVLEAFQSIYKVKCVSHAEAGNELSPGHVMVIPVPNLRGRNAFDPLRPLTSLGLLEDIKSFLAKITTPHLELEVLNPLFEEIQLEFDVQYRSEDTAFFTQQLRSDLEQFLAPWAFDNSSDIRFGSSVNKSVLINFIEERPYVDYISGVKMYRISEGHRSNDLEEAFATTSRSIFVSVKAEDPVYPHIIHENSCVC